MIPGTDRRRRPGGGRKTDFYEKKYVFTTSERLILDYIKIVLRSDVSDYLIRKGLSDVETLLMKDPSLFRTYEIRTFVERARVTLPKIKAFRNRVYKAAIKKEQEREMKEKKARAEAQEQKRKETYMQSQDEQLARAFPHPEKFYQLLSRSADTWDDSWEPIAEDIRNITGLLHITAEDCADYIKRMRDRARPAGESKEEGAAP